MSNYLLLLHTSIPSQQCAVQRIEGTKRLSLRGHFITCVSCGEGQGRLVAQSVLVLPTPAHLHDSHLPNLSLPLSFLSLIQTPCVCDSSDIGKFCDKYALSEDRMLKYQIEHGRAWPLIGYILSCLVSPLSSTALHL